MRAGASDAQVTILSPFHPRYTEVGCTVLVVTADSGLDEAALRAYCRDRLTSFKVPKYVVQSDQLPRNASGKILKYEQYEEVVGDR